MDELALEVLALPVPAGAVGYDLIGAVPDEAECGLYDQLSDCTGYGG